MTIKKSLVSIIIINWNGIHDTIECLNSLMEQAYRNFEIVVVDNNSKDNQAEKLRRHFPHIHLIKNKSNLGFAEASNQGIKMGLDFKSDYLLLLNNDTVVHKEFLTTLIKDAQQDSKLGLLSSKILYYRSKRIWSMGGQISYLTGISFMIGKNEDSSRYYDSIFPEFLTGCVLLIKSKLVRKIGLLNPDYFAYYEDIDYSFRARRRGYLLKTVPKSIVYHKKSASAGVSGSTKISPLQSYLWARNSLLFANLNLFGFKKLTFDLGSIFIRPVMFLPRFASWKSFLNYYKGIISGVFAI